MAITYPTLAQISQSRDFIEQFGGYDHNTRILDSSFYEMRNMTSNDYPNLCVRPKRSVYATPADAVQGMISKDMLGYVDGRYFVLGSERVDMNLSTAQGDCPKTLVSMGAYVIILPDKKYINTANLTDFGKIEASYTSTTQVTFRMCGIDGEDYVPKYVSATAPEKPENGDLWIDTSDNPHQLKSYSQTTGMWTALAVTYVKITSAGLGKAFSKFDGVELSGISGTLHDATSGDEFTDEQMAQLVGSTVVWDCGEDFIIVTGILDHVRTITDAVTISRLMPNMDFVIESQNRLWGCRYGTSRTGEIVNEIYASKLGDFKNWNCFMGASTDSYAANVGTDGKFTGAITHLGYPLFFKEGNLHKVYGNYPSNYQIQTTACRGVQEGSHKSLAIVGETLFYKSRNGICAYDGSLPQDVSAQFGGVMYYEAVAGAHGNKYIVSMHDSAGMYRLFVYDDQRYLWHAEDTLQVEEFCSCRDHMYYVDAADGKIHMMDASGTDAEGDIPWMVETGILGASRPDRKYISRLTVRMMMEIGARATFFAQYDSSGAWEQLSTVASHNLRTFGISLRTRRCDHLRIRIEGEGNMKIFSISKTYTEGSDV